MNNEGFVEKNDEMVTSEKSGRESGKWRGEEEIKETSQWQRQSYPYASSKKDKERHYKNFLDIFKRLQINIAFFEALEQMPTYAKFNESLRYRAGRGKLKEKHYWFTRSLINELSGGGNFDGSKAFIKR